MSTIEFAHHQLDIPLIQGGMGIGISLGRLAGTVAKHGGMGVVSGVNPGYRNPTFMQDPLKANGQALIEEVAKAKDIAQGKGMVAVNLMFAMRAFEEMIAYAVKAKADAIICGAGMALTLPSLVPDDMLIAPIVSSKRALRLIVSTWERRYQRLPDFVVCEGKSAGGHLGFKAEEIADASLDELVKEARAFLDTYNKNRTYPIWLFAAGGIRTAARRRALEAIGADGIQVGTPFIATDECDADIGFKRTIVESHDDDLRIIQSPAGFPARAIANKFLKEEVPIFGRCIACLKTCDPKTTPYCLSKALAESAKGRTGLVFSGEDINNITEIVPASQVIAQLMEDV